MEGGGGGEGEKGQEGKGRGGIYLCIYFKSRQFQYFLSPTLTHSSFGS